TTGQPVRASSGVTPLNDETAASVVSSTNHANAGVRTGPCQVAKTRCRGNRGRGLEPICMQSVAVRPCSSTPTADRTVGCRQATEFVTHSLQNCLRQSKCRSPKLGYLFPGYQRQLLF